MTEDEKKVIKAFTNTFDDIYGSITILRELVSILQIDMQEVRKVLGLEKLND